MKNFWMYISIVLVFLLHASFMQGTFLSAEREVGEHMELLPNSFDIAPSADCILPITADPWDGLEFEDAESMARQLRTCGRGLRQFTFHSIVLSKSLSSKVARNCMDALLESYSHIYSSLPCLSWEVSSEHYIFGMRRILI